MPWRLPLPLDSEEIYSRAIQEVSDRYGGKTFTWELKVRQMGLVSADLAALVVKELQLPITAEEYLAEVGPVNVRLFPSANLMPGTCLTRTSQTHRIVRCEGQLERTPFRLFSYFKGIFHLISVFEFDFLFIYLLFCSMHVTIVSDCFVPSKFHHLLYGYTGAERLLRHLHSKGVHIALATSSSRENYELKTTHHGNVFQLFKHIVTGSSDPEVKAGKPAPDIFLICASRFPEPAPHPSQVYFIHLFRFN